MLVITINTLNVSKHLASIYSTIAKEIFSLSNKISHK